LNRSGAAGWVFDGSVWFVAKRLADAVRQHIRERHPDESVPGDNKNDRLFDTWQEYGCIMLNPQSGQAIWHVMVNGSPVGGPTSEAGISDQESGEGDGSYSHSLSMLRFPLEKLFEEESAYPPAMRGHIDVVVKAQARATEEAADAPPDRAPAAPAAPAVAVEAVKPQRPKSEPKADILRAPAFKSPRPAKPAAPPPQAPKSTPSAEPTALPMAPAEVEPPLDSWLDFEDDAVSFKQFPKLPQKAASPEPEKPSAPVAPPVKPEPAARRPSKPAVPAVPFKSAKPATKPHPEELPSLPEMPQERPLLVRSALPPTVAARTAPARLETAPVLLNPFLPELPHETAGKRSEPTQMALAFVEWLQQGLASRELKYNETGALVHFTLEGMALVSPLVFRTFVAEQEPSSDSEADAQALQVQREVIKAGWHLMGPGKVNILKYQVMGRGGVPVGKLSAVVLTQPDRWVMPVPPPNPVLKLI
jgi:hypothetical protein